METRANYVLIGAFTLAGFAGLIAFLAWFASFDLDRRFAYYDVRFTSVSGLARASEVRFAGLPVGQVVDVRLSPDLDGTVLVRLEVSADTPVRADSVATIESLGVTGVSYVGISAGSADEPLLTAVDDDAVPEITAGRSVLQTLTEDAPELVAQTLRIVQEVGELFGPDNQARFEAILVNLEESSGDLGRALDDFATVTGVVAASATDIAFFTTQLEPLTGAVERTLETVDTALSTVTATAGRLTVTLDEGDALLATGRQTLASIDSFVSADLPVAIDAFTDTTRQLRGEIDRLGSEAGLLMADLRTTSAAATARLDQAEETLTAANRLAARLETTLARVDRTAESVETLVAGDGAALLSETRAAVAGASGAIASVSRIAEEDLPAIIADVRTATADATRVVREVGSDLSDASGRVDGLAQTAEEAVARASEVFGRAGATLEAIETALATGERTLEAAERAFTGADRVINEDVDGIVADLRSALARLDVALAQVSDDIPQITGDLRQAAESADEAFAELQAIAREARGPLREFLNTALPQFAQLSRESRGLVAEFQRLIRQIERDPARFFFSRQTPEFRR